MRQHVRRDGPRTGAGVELEVGPAGRHVGHGLRGGHAQPHADAVGLAAEAEHVAGVGRVAAELEPLPRHVRGHPVRPRGGAAPEIGDGRVRRVTGHRAGVGQRQAGGEAGVAPQQPEREHTLRHADAADVRPPPLAERPGPGHVEEDRGSGGARGRVEHPLDRAAHVERRDLAPVRVAHPALEREQERAEVARGVRQVAREAGHEGVALRRRRVGIRERRRAGGERDAPRRGRAGVGRVERDVGRAEGQPQRAAGPRRRPRGRWRRVLSVVGRAAATRRRERQEEEQECPARSHRDRLSTRSGSRRANRDDHDRRNGTPAASSSRRRSAAAASVASRATWSAVQAAEVTKFASVTWQLPQNSG